MNGPSSIESSLISLGCSIFARGGRRASLVVLKFHRVLPERDPLLPSEPDARAFSAQMDLIATKFNVLALSDGIRKLREQSLPARALCVTFDDGYANNCTVALPILAAKGIPVTVFIATGFLNGGRMFNDTVIESVRSAPAEFDLRDMGLDVYRLSDDNSRLDAIERIIQKLKHLEPAARLRSANEISARAGLEDRSELMLSDDQVRHLFKAGIQIGAHTVNHPILTAVDADTARNEMTASKIRLEEITGSPVSVFAYPNGKPTTDYDHTHVALVRDVGFEAALSTAWGAADRDSDIFQIPRIAPWDKSALRYGLRIARGYRQRSYERALIQG
jgi:peptidoglycan/xylan/chitin deacetylase (PgdA/CDA1 family)